MNVGIENVLLFRGSECASDLSCIFVVEVEGALQFFMWRKVVFLFHSFFWENAVF